jgi:hypothetical protein
MHARLSFVTLSFANLTCYPNSIPISSVIRLLVAPINFPKPYCTPFSIALSEARRSIPCVFLSRPRSTMGERKTLERFLILRLAAAVLFG